MQRPIGPKGVLFLPAFSRHQHTLQQMSFACTIIILVETLTSVNDLVLHANANSINQNDRYASPTLKLHFKKKCQFCPTPPLGK